MARRSSRRTTMLRRCSGDAAVAHADDLPLPSRTLIFCHHHQRVSRRRQDGLPGRVGSSGGQGGTTRRQREIAGSRRAQATMGDNARGNGVVLGEGRRRHRSRDSELSAKRPPKFKIGGGRDHRGRRRRDGRLKLPLRRGNDVLGDVRALDVGRRRRRRSRDDDLRAKEASKIRNAAIAGRLPQQVEEVLLLRRAHGTRRGKRGVAAVIATGAGIGHGT